jgi:iron complex transport system substrate-binding protein
MIAGAWAVGVGGSTKPAPRRVASLNACLDAMLVHLADRSQIAALSHYARDEHSSTVAATAKTLPFTWESAEEIIALEPDLVLASKHSALATRNALKRLHVPVERFAVPNPSKRASPRSRRSRVSLAIQSGAGR